MTTAKILNEAVSAICKVGIDPVQIKVCLEKFATNIRHDAFTAAGAPHTSIDLDLLFAPPTQDEKTAIINEWNNRDTSAVNATVVKDGTLGGCKCQVIRHEVQGGTQYHYGFLRYPPNYDPKLTYNALVWCHGGYQGIDVSVLNWFDNIFLPSHALKDSCIYVVPSYRGEALTVPVWGTWTSGGSKSKADYDVDDTMMLMDAAFDLVETPRLRWYGQSRGATVALLADLRGNSGLDRLAELFGGTDCFQDYIKNDCKRYLMNHTIPQDRVSALIIQVAVMPWVRGELTLSEARLELLRRSPSYFADKLSPSSIHHGGADPLVNFTHTQNLEAALQAAGIEYEAFLYPNGVHDPDTLPGCGAKVEAWLNQ